MVDLKQITAKICTIDIYNHILNDLQYPAFCPSRKHYDEVATIISSPSFSSFPDLVHCLSQDQMELLRYVQVYDPLTQSYTRFVDGKKLFEKERVLQEASAVAQRQGKLLLEFDNPHLGELNNKWTTNSYHFWRKKGGMVLCVRAYFGIGLDVFENVVVQDGYGKAMNLFSRPTRHLYAAGNLEQITLRSASGH